MMIENLSTTERDILLRWFLHYMPVGKSDGAAGLPDADATKATRFEFMRQFPAIYNRLAGAEIVRVVHVSSGHRYRERIMHTLQADFQIDRHGNIIGITPMNGAAHEWLDENCQTEGWEWLGRTLNVHLRVAPAIVEGIAAAGFIME